MRRSVLLLFCILGIACGCSKKAIIRKYYLIEIPSTADSTRFADSLFTDASCEILPVKIYPAFGRDRIALRLQTHELTYYTYHQWAVKPDDMMTQLTENYLQNSRLFGVVSIRFWKLIPDYQIEVQVSQLEAVQENKKLSAHLRIDFNVFDAASKQPVVSHSADQYLPLKKNNINLFASAISELYYKELQIFSEKTRKYLESTYPRGAEKQKL